MKKIWGLSCVVLVACAVLTFCLFKPDAKLEARLVEQVQQAKDVDALGDVYDKACGSAWGWELERLKKCQNPGIAIQAAWEEVRRTIPTKTPERKPMPAKNNTTAMARSPTRINPEALLCFLEFVESHLSVSMPWWWKDAISKASYMFGTADSLAHRDRGIGCLTSPESWNYLVYYPTQAGLEAPVGISVVTTNSGLRISKGRESFDIPMSVIKKANESMSDDILAPRGVCCVNMAAVDAERFVIVFCISGIARGFPLLCVSRSTGKIIWEARVWMARPIGGHYFSYLVPRFPIDIKVANDAVYVFGLCLKSAYIEAFSLADGKNVFRFSTSY